MNQFEYIDATRGTEDKQIIDIARGWVMDCVDDPENVLSAPDKDVRRYVEQFYEGGWEAFLEECC